MPNKLNGMRDTRKIISAATAGKQRKIKAKDIGQGTLLYIADALRISAVTPDAVERTPEGKVKINFKGRYRRGAEADPEAVEIGKYYLNFQDARDKQNKLRAEILKSSLDGIANAITKYGELLELYVGIPLTTEEEVEIWDC